MAISKNISKFYRKISIFTLFFNLSKIWQKTLPPWSAPGEPLYIWIWPFFFLIIILDLKEAKSAKKVHIKILRIFRPLEQTIPLMKWRPLQGFTEWIIFQCSNFVNQNSREIHYMRSQSWLFKLMGFLNLIKLLLLSFPVPT